MLQRLGEPFNFDGDSAVADSTGLGLGLVSTKKLIERHGGSMAIESAPGEGTTFEILIPVSAPVREFDAIAVGTRTGAQPAGRSRRTSSARRNCIAFASRFP